MSFRPRDLWTFSGTVNRRTYALAGLVGVAVKFNLDRLVGIGFFERRWGLWSYWNPFERSASFRSLSPADRWFLLGMLATALPFIWIGVAMTVRRLRSIGLPIWMVVLFFLPLLNLVFFAALCLIPARTQPMNSGARRETSFSRTIARWMPRSRAGAAAVAAFITAAVGVGATIFSTTYLRSYGLGLFVALPFFLGLIAVLVAGYREPVSLRESVVISALATLLVGVAIVCVAIEGILCLLMALPLGLPLSVLGGIVGFFIQQARYGRRDRPVAFLSVVLAAPALMGLEAVCVPPPRPYAVTTSVTIAASPESVWKNVISFGEISEAPTWLFRAGIACPLSARIDGAGVGAVRHCVFTTGEFVEPIDVWLEPRLLKFRVTSNPPPMRELSPYAGLVAPHLEGFLRSSAGEFRLTELPDGGTKLEGTTWYQHGLWPEAYWHLWSNRLIHQIHGRVLRHIKALSEAHRFLIVTELMGSTQRSAHHDAPDRTGSPSS